MFPNLVESRKDQISNRLICRQIDGGRDRDRTGDPLLAKQVLCQLSYTPIEIGSLEDRNLSILRILLSSFCCACQFVVARDTFQRS